MSALPTTATAPTPLADSGAVADSTGRASWVQSSIDTAAFIAALCPPGATVYDTDWITTGIVTPNTGLTIVNQYFRRQGKKVNFSVSCTASVAFTPSASGDISNTAFVLNVASGWYPTTGPAQGVGSGSLGRLSGGGIFTTGTMNVVSIAGSASISVGDPLSFSGSYTLD